MYLARSKAGHDKGECYLVKDENETCVFLVNGTTKPLSRPKKKKKIHIQPIRRLPEEVAALLPEEAEKADDVIVKRILKLYKRSSLEESDTDCVTNI